MTLLDGKMAEVRDGMVNVQQGIMLLCHTVAEVTNRIGMHNTRSSQALKGFLGGSGAALPHGQQQEHQFSLPPVAPQSAAGGAGGLNLLLEGGGATADIDATVFEIPLGAAAEQGKHAGVTQLAGSRSIGGPPSFPKTTTASNPMASGKPASTSSVPFWGMGRS